MLKLARKLIEAVSSWNGQEFQKLSANGMSENLQELKEWQQSYLDNEKMLGTKGKRIGLADYGNNVSIVFHSVSTNPGIPKILFTGDFPKKYWDDIKDKLQEKYDVVKIPHHGTERYYWEHLNNYFSNKTTVLIPNGDAAKQGWYIDFRYPEHLNLSKANYKIYCFDVAACPAALGNGHKCVCHNNSGCISNQNPQKVYIEFTLP